MWRGQMLAKGLNWGWRTSYVHFLRFLHDSEQQNYHWRLYLQSQICLLGICLNSEKLLIFLFILSWLCETRCRKGLCPPLFTIFSFQMIVWYKESIFCRVKNKERCFPYANSRQYINSSVDEVSNDVLQSCNSHNNLKYRTFLFSSIALLLLSGGYYQV